MPTEFANQITAEEARALVQSEGLESLDDIYHQIRTACSNGEYETLWTGDYTPATITQLTTDGYVVTEVSIEDKTNLNINWEAP